MRWRRLKLRAQSWRLKFAWYPRRDISGEWVWLERAWCCEHVYTRSSDDIDQP